MVAEINTGASLYGALSYNQNKIDEGTAKFIYSNKVVVNTENFSFSNCLRSFEEHIPQDIKTQKSVAHISLNPHPDDKLSDADLMIIAQEYMDKIGFGEQPYVIYKHEDISRHHLHIVALRVKDDGKLIKDSNNFRVSNKATRELEEKYNLIPAVDQKRGEQWELTPIDYTKGDVKKQIGSVIRPLSTMYHFQTMGEYKAALSLYNINVEEVKGEAKGKPYRGLLYSALNDKGEKVGSPLKSSIFGKTVGYDGLEKRFEKSAEQIKTKNLKKHTYRAVTDAKANSTTESEFRAQLKDQGIDVLFRRNDQDRIYGATFIDHSTRTVLNGSRLGKDFSANIFNDLYGTGQKQEVLQNKPDSITPTVVNQTDNNQVDTNVVSLFGGLISNPEPEKEYMPRKRKKKRRYGRQD